MLQRVRELIKSVYEKYDALERKGNNLASGGLYALEDLRRELDKIEPVEGVWVEDYKIEIFDPKTGEVIVCWNQPTRGMVDAALAVRTFYAEGPEALKKIVR